VATRIPEAPLHRLGYWQARPGDVIGRNDLFMVDVRAAEDDLLGELGHIHGVRHVPAARVRAAGLPQVPKDQPVVVVCQNGHESFEVAVSLVRDHGFDEVYHLVGGMIRWVAEERPIARVPTWR
jgi:rhodanese-related sulfurtransferase